MSEAKQLVQDFENAVLNFNEYNDCPSAAELNSCREALIGAVESCCGELKT